MGAQALARVLEYDTHIKELIIEQPISKEQLAIIGKGIGKNKTLRLLRVKLDKVEKKKKLVLGDFYESIKDNKSLRYIDWQVSEKKYVKNLR